MLRFVSTTKSRRSAGRQLPCLPAEICLKSLILNRAAIVMNYLHLTLEDVV
jgi:hypothetical protein